jgi:thiol-disulfide isomerase/thioredoxin
VTLNDVLQFTTAEINKTTARMKRLFSLTFFTLISLSAVFANVKPGFNIKIKLENYAATELVLGFHYGEKQYVKDTAVVDADGWFTFSADTLLPPGIYLLVLKPDNNFLQILMPENDQEFTLTSDVKDSVNKMKFKGSSDNDIFYEYLRFLNKQRPEADSLRAKLSRAKGNVADSTRYSKELEGLDKIVKKFQADLISKHPGTLSERITKASIDPEVPEFKGDDMEKARQRYYWVREHFFDNIDLTDPALLRSPVLHAKVDQYMTKIAPQHPDSINVAIDYILAKIKNAPEINKYFLVHFLNYYAKSQIVGFDACYVHIAQTYYCVGQAPWTKKEDLEKICDNALRLEPILIGKTAPNIVVTDRQNKPHALWDVDADYTVLFFWAPDCGHCKKAAPFMVEFAQHFKDKGVKVFAVCSAVAKTVEEGDVPDCWKGVEEKGFTDDLFMNMADPFIRSRYKKLYDIQSTPQIFVLDRSHKILMKRIGAEQITTVMEEVMKNEAEKKKKK